MAAEVQAVAATTEVDPMGLLNKYALPKVAMVVIATAAALGTTLTTVVGGRLGYPDAAARYLLLMGSGTAAGGLLWAWQVVAPAARLVGGPDAEAYAIRQWLLFRRIQRWACGAAAVGLAVLGPTYWALAGPGRTAERMALALAVGAWLAWAWQVHSAERSGAEDIVRAPSHAAGGLAAVSLLLWAAAFLQVWHDGYGDWQVLAWRLLHLSAFAAWFGGAVWNVAIAVRAARANLSVPVIIAANAQLERFRRIVRIALPLILTTGLLQVWDYVGFTRWAWSGVFGHFVLAKLGLIGVLVVIFMTCPMWHACSPIAGMCDLDDLKPGTRGTPRARGD